MAIQIYPGLRVLCVVNIQLKFVAEGTSGEKNVTFVLQVSVNVELTLLMLNLFCSFAKRGKLEKSVNYVISLQRTSLHVCSLKYECPISAITYVLVIASNIQKTCMTDYIDCI